MPTCDLMLVAPVSDPVPVLALVCRSAYRCVCIYESTHTHTILCSEKEYVCESVFVYESVCVYVCMPTHTLSSKIYTYAFLKNEITS